MLSEIRDGVHIGQQVVLSSLDFHAMFNEYSMHGKKLFATLVAVHTWKTNWAEQTILFIEKSRGS